MKEISTILMVMIVVFTVGYIIHSFRMIFPSKKSRMAQEAKWREEDLREIRKAIARMDELEKNGVNNDK